MASWLVEEVFPRLRVMIRRLLLAGAILFLAPNIAGAQPSTEHKDFLVFDNLLYKDKPDLSKYGIQPLRGMNPPHELGDPRGPVNLVKVRDSMKSLNHYSGIVYLDYEMWPLTNAPGEVIAESVKKYILVADIAHGEAPSARIGYYGSMPCREYWGLVNHDLKKLRDWKECNRRGEEIAAHLQVIFPSLYTFYNDQESWDIYARGMIEEARRYHLPVYVFLWPEFHPSNMLLKGANIPAKFWRHQLEFCRESSVGIVIWGGWQEQWQEEAAWWVETKKFMAAIKSQRP